ncbi:uncharacterized protein LOC143299069 [Babylonia areolata]|uniref:uncharacterized protein LOC143299069 n=1 Tax=Babylonia areolata TaxID=304850 RepID=UPI003FD49A37
MNTSSVLGFAGTRNATFKNSALSGNFSHDMKSNDSQDVDLEALNLVKTRALTPTIVYLAVLMVVGAVGNTIAFLVYYKRFKPSATRTYILAMSLCDLLANVLSLPSEIIDIRHWYTFDLPVLCMCMRGSNSFLTLTSAFLLLAVATDRFNKICRPLEKQSPLRRIKLHVIICVLASLALSVVFAALNGSRTLPTGVGNVTGTTCSVSDQFRDTLFPMVYNGIMALTFLVCVTIMMVCYIRIALELWRHKKRQERMSGKAPVGKASPAKDSPKALTPIAEDTSPRQINRLHQSATDSCSSSELIPLKSAGKKNTEINPSPKSSASGSHTQDLLLSVKYLNCEGPRSLVEDCDQGCFTGCNVDTTFTLVNHSNPEQAPNDQEGRGAQTRVIHEVPDTPMKTVTSDTKAGCSDTVEEEEAESTQNSSTELSRASFQGDRVVPGHDSPTEISSASSHDRQNIPATRRDIQTPTNHPPTPAHHTMVDRFSSLLHRLLTPRARHQGDDDDAKDVPGKTPIPCRVPRKRGAVKTIPSRTTLMMFVLTAAFIVSYLPFLIVNILRALTEAYFDEGLGNSALNGYNIALRSYFVNCAANSIVYGFCSARFRQECRLLFRRQ